MVKITSTLMTLACFSLFLSGCFGKSSATAAATPAAASPACTFTESSGGYSQTECLLFVSTTAQTGITTGCTAVSGVTSATCSTTSVLGVCKNPTATSDSGLSSITYYSGGIFTDSTAQTDCTTTQMGTYTSG